MKKVHQYHNAFENFVR